MMFILALVSFNVFEKLFVVNICGCESSGYLLQVENVEGWKVDLFWMKRPVMWVVNKIKEVIKKLKG